MSDIIGKTIGHYQIIEQIGMGGMATVYKAYQLSMDRYVAIKILPSQFAQDPNFVKRFAHEAKAIAALEHPHILPVHDFGMEDNLNYMVMRYVEGGTLANLMGKRIPYEQITRIIGNVARALNYAHQKGVVHRDIKPSNILIDQHGEVLLTDFGIAKIVEGAKATQLTADGSILGTPAYMAPEQAKGTQVDGRTDIYSLGVVLYELLTGRPPYEAETPFAVALKHITEPLPPPRSLNPDIPEPFERVVLKAMAKEPEQRYQTAGQMAQALENALKEGEAPAAGTKLISPSPQPTQVVVPKAAKERSLKPILIGGAVALVLLCLLAIGAFAGLAMLGSTTDEVASSSPIPTSPIRTNAGGGVVGSKATPTEPTSTPTEVAVGPTEPPEIETPTVEPTATPLEVEIIEPGETPATTEPATTLVATDEAEEIDELDQGILFEEDFSANEVDWFVGEDTDEISEYRAEIVDGRYWNEMIAVSEDGAVIWNEPPETEFDDFIYSVEVTKIDQSGEVSYGIIFRSDGEGNFYIFEIDDAGFIVSLAQAESDWETLLDYTETSAIVPGGPNQLEVEAIGNSFTFYINGEEVATLEDDRFEEGRIGLAISTYNKGDKLVVEFDNLLVTEP